MKGCPLKPTTKPLEELSTQEIEYLMSFDCSWILGRGRPSSPKGTSSLDLSSSSMLTFKTCMKSVFSFKMNMQLSSVAIIKYGEFFIQQWSTIIFFLS